MKSNHPFPCIARRCYTHLCGWLLFFSASVALYAAPPANDALSAAVPLPQGVTVAGTTVDATWNDEEDAGPDGPDGGPREPRTVWYRWTGVAGYQVARLSYDDDEGSAKVRVFRGLPGILPWIAEDAFGRYLANQNLSEARFLAEAGVEYFLAVSSPEDAPTSFTLKLEALTTRAPQDDFAQAILLSTAGGVMNTAGATQQPDEPPARSRLAPYGDLQGTVWARWVAPHDGNFFASITLSFWDESLLEVFRGNAFPLTPAELGRPGRGGAYFNPGANNRVTFAAVAGETVYFRLASNSEGSGTLSIGAAVPGDQFAAPLEAGNAPAWAFQVPYTNLTLEPYEATGPSGSAWVRWASPDNAVYEMEVTRLGWFAGNSSILGLAPVARVYLGNSLNALNSVPAVPLGIVTTPTRFRAEAGQVYRIQCGLTPYAGQLSNQAQGTSLSVFAAAEFKVQLRRLGVPPPNDHFANAGDLGSGPATVTGTNVAATAETGESIPGYHAGDSVWHSWTAPATGGKWEVTVDSPQAQLRLEVIPRATISSIALLAERDFYPDNPAGGKLPLRLRWTAESGVKYHFRLAGRGYGAQGAYTLRLRQLTSPSNDEEIHAGLLTGNFPITATGTTIDATPENYVANPGNAQDPWSTVWWKWVAPATTWVQVDALGAALGVTENGYPMGYSLSGTQHSIRFRAIAGRTYHLRLASSADAEGPVSLTLSAALGMEHVTPETALNLGSAASVPSFPSTVQPGSAYASTMTVAIPVTWYRWTAPFSGWFSFDSEGSERAVNLGLFDGPNPDGGSLSLASSAGYPQNFTENNAAQFEFPVSRLLVQLTVGRSYWLSASNWNEVPSIVQVNLQPAGPPPTVTALEVRTGNPAPERPRWAEVMIQVTAPNGLSSGQIFGLPYYFTRSMTSGLIAGLPIFTDAQRISGDAFNGIYRIRLDIGSRYEILEGAYPLGVSITDHRGGKFTNYHLASLPAQAQWTADATPPVLESLSSLPAVVTLGDSPQSLTMRLAISDRGGSGFLEGAVFLGAAALGQFSVDAPTQRDWPIAVFSSAQRVQGDAQDGIYEVTLTLPGHLPLSPLGLRYRIRDAAGNEPRFYQMDWSSNDVWTLSLPQVTSDLTLPCTLEQSGTVDEAPPTLTYFDATFDGTNPAAAPGEITIAVKIADAVSGFSHGEVSLLDANKVVETSLALTAVHRVSGNATNGIYLVKFPLPAWGYGGRHYARLTVHDGSGLRTTVLTELHSISDLVIPNRTDLDQRPPRLTYFQLSPATLDLRTGPATVHVALGASDDRPGLTGRLSIFDSRGHPLASQALSCAIPVLACNFDLTLPQRFYPGPGTNAMIVLEIRDAAGRTESYGLPNTSAWPEGSAAALRIQPSAADALTRWSADFPSYHLPTNLQADTDGDGTADLIEFALGTDPTVRSIPPQPSTTIALGNLNAPLPVNVPIGIDLRSHRLPTFTCASQAFGNGVSVDRTLFPPSCIFSYTPSPLMVTSAWPSSLQLQAVTTTDLIHWSPLNSEPDNSGRQIIIQPATAAHQWFRLRLGSP